MPLSEEQKDNLKKTYELNKAEITSRWINDVSSFIKLFLGTTISFIASLVSFSGDNPIVNSPKAFFISLIIIGICLFCTALVIFAGSFSIVSMGIENWHIEKKLEMGDYGIEHSAFKCNKPEFQKGFLWNCVKWFFKPRIYHRILIYLFALSILVVILGTLMTLAIINIIIEKIYLEFIDYYYYIPMGLVILSFSLVIFCRIMGEIFNLTVKPNKTTIEEIKSYYSPSSTSSTPTQPKIS